jgi:hypothetical protein
MLRYKASDPYKTDTHIIHFILMGVCLVIILAGALIYFD